MDFLQNLPVWAQQTVTIVGLLIFWAVLWTLTSRLVTRHRKNLEEREPGSFKTLRIQNYNVLTGRDIKAARIMIVRAVGFVAKTAIFFVGLGTVLSVHPSTASVMDTAYAAILVDLTATLNALVNYLPDLLFLVILFIIVRFGLRILRLFFQGLKRERIEFAGFYPEWADPTYKLVRFMVILFALILAFPYLPGNDSPAFQAASLFLGILVSLGSAGAVANIIAGIMIIYMRAFEIGDYVRIADAEGNVIERSMFVTRIITRKNVEIAIPNSMVLSNHIINFSAQAREGSLVLHTEVTIGYDVPWQKVHDCLLEAAKKTDGIEDNPSPFVLQTGLDDFYVSYQINGHTKEPQRMAEIYSNLYSHIQNAFHAAKIEIASPHLSAIRDGNQLNIPDDYLPKNFNPPGFRFSLFK